MDKLPETRLQLAQCDGHMFFTDDQATLDEPAPDITRVTVPKQVVDRQKQDWLNHKNMAALTPVWLYLLQNGTVEKFDWVLHVELDHFTRPSMVRLAIAETLGTLRAGTKWERSFFENSTGAPTKPLMLAFGNAYIFNRALVALMKLHFPLPGMTKDHGCPSWSPGHCEQDMVYPRMMGFFHPPVQMFGSTGCGKVQATWGGKKLPLGCWEFFQNPSELGPEHQSQSGQQRAIAEIATGQKGRLPSVTDHAPAATTPRLLSIDAGVGDEEGDGVGEQEEIRWEGFLPPSKVPIIHHVFNSAVLRDARLFLGL